MRPDMAKVLVERPRANHGGSGRGYGRCLQRTPVEDWPAREGIKRRCGGGTKSFTDRLGPLRRFLRSQVGRPWDVVYSEICARLPGRFPVREHFLRHVFDYVALHVVEEDGTPCVGEGRGYGTPLHVQRYRAFYVCPRTGLLKQVQAPRRG
jgi:hypothetical protein